jgi:glutathione S-transferase
MILIGQFDSPFVRRVAVTLNHYHMPFTRNPLSIFRNAAEVQKINPLLRVPALILETGESLIDSHAIIDHLDEMAGPARALTPRHGPERRHVLQAVYLAAGLAEKVVQLFFERLNHPDKMLAKDWEKRLLSQITTSLEKLEHDCGTPWFFDNKLSQADVTAACMLMHMKMRVPECFPATKYPKLHAMALHCETLDAFANARPGADETVPSAKS